MFPRDLKGTSLVCCRCALLVTLDLLRDGIYLLFRAAQRRKYDAVEAIPQQCHALALSSHRISLVTIKGYCPKALLSSSSLQAPPWRFLERRESLDVCVICSKATVLPYPLFMGQTGICNGMKRDFKRQSDSRISSDDAYKTIRRPWLQLMNYGFWRIWNVIPVTALCH